MYRRVRGFLHLCLMRDAHYCAVFAFRSPGDATKYLLDFIELNLPKGATLGVSEAKLGSSISENAGIKVKSNETVLELMRGIRAHYTRFIKELKAGDAQQAMLGLGHSYSRSKVKFNVHRVDNNIIQVPTHTKTQSPLRLRGGGKPGFGGRPRLPVKEEAQARRRQQFRDSKARSRARESAF